MIQGIAAAMGTTDILFLIAIGFTQEVAFQDSIGDGRHDQADRAHRIVVGGDEVFDFIRITVAIHQRKHGDAQDVGFFDRGRFADGIDDEDEFGKARHAADAAEAQLQRIDFALHHEPLFLGELLEFAGLAPILQLFERVDALPDGAPVGEHPAQPAMGHIRHPATGGLLLDDLLCLAFGAHEQHFAAFHDEVDDVLVEVAQVDDGLPQIQDVDAIAFGEDIRCHLRVPLLGLMAEVAARFEQVFQGQFKGHGGWSPILCLRVHASHP